MKIAAIIPARAGSKEIPNKNIRIVNGHPLVYYAIHNALSSKYITDVIVTTDSPEVRIIAEQLGAECKWRDAKLCEDSVGLDIVVYDALPAGKEWDYIITMQPTSPTLKVEMLDKAIQYAMDKDYDTVISAINAPSLSWRKEKDRICPNYEKRLNRQYLPPCYVETGAFFISKASVVTPSSRFGTKVGIFEIPKEQAVDIDTFQDMQIASAILEQPKVAIYANGNNTRGIGHVYRALELADEFFVRPDIYYDSNQTERSIFGRTTHNVVAVNGIAELFEWCKKRKYTIFINDILNTSLDYMYGLRSVLPDAKIINFEDDGEGSLQADLVFNALYPDKQETRIKGGEKYYISPKLFMFYEPIAIKERVQRVFICFGGADPKNYTDRLLSMITKREYSEYEFTVVLGKAKNNVEALLTYNRYPNIQVYYDAGNMPELMSDCDIGITSRGRTGYELAILGIPVIVMAQNEREEKHSFVSNENGFTYIGLNPPDEVIESTLKMYLEMSKESRQRYQTMLLRHDLRSGRKRVMNLINNI